MKVLKSIFLFFSSYVNFFERKVDRFFVKLTSDSMSFEVEKKLLALMKDDLVIVNVWLEKKFRGYKYLKKSVRRKMYSDTKIIVKRFSEYVDAHPVDVDNLRKRLNNAGHDLPLASEKEFSYIFQIMEYLRPGGVYRYIKTASFGKLLRNPDEFKLEGDCNQIVTFYSYLYGLKFPLSDLKIKLLPQHVCLHFRGVDIEATNGTFQKYVENRDVLPITEIISTNLLDLSDFREDAQHISPRVMIKSSQLAFAISSLKSFVAKNLEVAYRNLAISELKHSGFESAVFYAKKSGDSNLLSSIYHSAVVSYLKNHNFKKALYFANANGNERLRKNVKYQEGVFYYKKGKYEKAIEIFRSINDKLMEKNCYIAQYNKLLKSVSSLKTVEQMRKKKSVYKKLLSLAQKMGDFSLADGLRKTLASL